MASCYSKDAVESRSDKPEDEATYHKFTLLPPELRLKVWNCAVEPRIVPLVDLVHSPRSHPLPGVTQLNAEARNEIRAGYEPVGRGSYFDFANDVLLCDYEFAEQTAHSVLENMAPQAERVLFWDCIPDDRFCRPDEYDDYLSHFYRQSRFGEILFDEFWFPNVKELWFIKVGDVDERWQVMPKGKAVLEDRLQHMAREFRYWVNENIIEMTELRLDEPEHRIIFREGRCERANCRELNGGRDHIISKVNFMDGKYEAASDGKKWIRINPATEDERFIEKMGRTSPAIVSRLRWLLVERTLTFLLRREPSAEDGHGVGRTPRC